MEKNYVKRRIGNFNISIFVGDIEKIVKILNETVSKYKKLGWKELSIISTAWNSTLYGKRLETDKEFESRKKRKANRIIELSKEIERKGKNLNRSKKRYNELLKTNNK